MTRAQRIVGAIIAGGQSRRFGSDKAAATIDGIPLIEHSRRALAPQVEVVLLCGRELGEGDSGGWIAVPDAPGPGLGPLGGLCGALGWAAAHGFDAVLSVPVDTYPLPQHFAALLGPAPAAFAGQHLVGLWPSALHPALLRHLAGGNGSVRSWIAASMARLVDDGALAMRNINRRQDLADVATLADTEGFEPSVGN